MEGLGTGFLSFSVTLSFLSAAIASLMASVAMRLFFTEAGGAVTRQPGSRDNVSARFVLFVEMLHAPAWIARMVYRCLRARAEVWGDVPQPNSPLRATPLAAIADVLRRGSESSVVSDTSYCARGMP